MAFEQSIQFVLQAEGGYVNHPNDKGGETYRGIARRMHPEWDGWEYIDDAKSKGYTMSCILLEKQYPQLLQSVYDFYKSEFWDILNCDSYHEAIAHLLFDFNVNSGKSRAVKHLQKGIAKTLNINLDIDGAIGDETNSYVQQIEQNNDASTLCENMLEDRQAFYYALVQHNPNQNVFLKGWLNRVNADLQFINENFFA